MPKAISEWLVAQGFRIRPSAWEASWYVYLDPDETAVLHFRRGEGFTFSGDGVRLKTFMPILTMVWFMDQESSDE